MRVIQLRVRPLYIYLLLLFLYGITMMLTNSEVSSLDQEADKFFDEEVISKIRNRKRSNRQIHMKNYEEPIKSVEEFFDLLNRTETICSKLVDIGGSSCKGARDHNKLFCMDDDMRIEPKHCNIYSFGIGEDITFDVEMYKYGCHVYMFDPTIPSDMVPVNLNERLQFFHLGLHTSSFERTFMWDFLAKDDFKNAERNISGSFDTYANIQKKINHVGKVVHYLKMDIDGSEWEVIPNLIRNNNFDHVQQFAVEIHTTEIVNKTTPEAVKILRKMWGVLHQLKDIGFERASYTPTPVLESMYKFPDRNETIPTCGEILFLRRGANILLKY